MRKNYIASAFGIAVMACISCVGSLSAQNLQAVTHGNVHNDLLASQSVIQHQIQLPETTSYIDNNYLEEEEPEMDIYEEGWNSGLVNCYQKATIPDEKVINVSKFAMPHPGYITSPYGYRRRFRRMHKGVDLKVQIGDTIRAAFDGKVRITKFERRGYGYYVVLRHENGLETVYGHLSKFLVEPNEYVKAGDPIALGGNTGRSTGSHLHFETRFMGYAINPAAIFDFENQTTHTDTYTFSKKTFENSRDYSPRSKSKNSTYASSGKSTYRVRKGDSLSKIAVRNGTTVAKLCKLNGISTSTKLQVGKVLRIN